MKIILDNKDTLNAVTNTEEVQENYQGDDASKLLDEIYEDVDTVKQAMQRLNDNLAELEELDLPEIIEEDNKKGSLTRFYDSVPEELKTVAKVAVGVAAGYALYKGGEYIIKQLSGSEE